MEHVATKSHEERKPGPVPEAGVAREQFLRIRFTDQEYEELRLAAECVGKDMAAFIRPVIQEMAHQAVLIQAGKDPKLALVAMIFEWAEVFDLDIIELFDLETDET